MKRSLATALVLIAASSASIAETVYRCGSDGREYSQSPCPGGQAVTVDDTRTPEQQQQAQDAALRQTLLGEQLASERAAREATASRQGAAGITAKPSSAAAPSRPASAPHHKHKKHPHAKKPVPAYPDLTAPMRVPAEPRPPKKAASGS